MLKRKKLITCCGLIIAALFLLFVYLRRQYVAPIIMYHSVRPQAVNGDMLIVSSHTFQRQMNFLKTHGYNVVPLEQLAQAVKEKRRPPPKTVAITFDDGNKDNYTYAFPILKKYNFVATEFIIVNEVGRPQGDKLSWDEIRQMQDSGVFSIGSHTLTHPVLINIKSPEELRREIFDSKRILEEKLAKPVHIFSYPEGRFNDDARKMVIAAGYKFAVTSNPGSGFSNDDIFALKRLRISENTKDLFVFWVETSGYYNYMREHRHRK